MNDEAETGRIRAIDLSYSETLYYLGSPYSKHHAGIEGAFQEISAIAARLIERGVPIFCPISHSHPIAIHGGLDPMSHDIWLPVDAHLMRVCGAMLIAKMDGWNKSYGVSEEIKAFRKAGKPIYTLDPETLIVEELPCD